MCQRTIVRGCGFVLSWAMATVICSLMPSSSLDAQEQLNSKSTSQDSESSSSPLDRALDDLPSTNGDLASQQAGPVTLRLMDLSTDLLFAVGGSTERDESLQSLQGGGHDPRKRGFTLQNLELSFLGAIDPFFSGEVHLIYFVEPVEGESVFELEEAFFTTQQLPFGLEQYGFEIEFGQMFSEIGRINPRHPHAWDWLDQPVINSRLFGPDGMRGLGMRLGWLTPLPWFSQFHLGVQNAGGETMASFLSSDELYEERAIGGLEFADREVRSLEDFVWLARWENSWSLSEELSTAIGVSGLVGPNASGSDGCSFVYGADFLLQWRPLESNRGYPFLTWQTEFLRRVYEVDSSATELSGEHLVDEGLYTQILWGFARDWAAGVRYEYARGDGASVGGRAADPFRDDRHRVAPLLTWTPTHFSRVRLQYNFDHADHLVDDAHSVWLGFEVLLGKHPAHGM